MFRTKSDDASFVSVNGQMVVENGGFHGATVRVGSIFLEGRQAYPITMYYGESTGPEAMFEFSWKKEDEEAWIYDLTGSFRPYASRPGESLARPECSLPLLPGETCPFLCEYPFRGSGLLKCVDGELENVGYCDAPCHGNPPLPVGGFLSGDCRDGMQSGDWCDFECDSPYGGGGYFTCDNGDWRQTGMCYAPCRGLPVLPKHGLHGDCAPLTRHGETCELRCQLYEKTSDFHCEKGEWQGAWCSPFRILEGCQRAGACVESGPVNVTCKVQILTFSVIGANLFRAQHGELMITAPGQGHTATDNFIDMRYDNLDGPDGILVDWFNMLEWRTSGVDDTLQICAWDQCYEEPQAVEHGEVGSGAINRYGDEGCAPALSGDRCPLRCEEPYVASGDLICRDGTWSEEICHLTPFHLEAGTCRHEGQCVVSSAWPSEHGEYERCDILMADSALLSLDGIIPAPLFRFPSGPLDRASGVPVRVGDRLLFYSNDAGAGWKLCPWPGCVSHPTPETNGTLAHCTAREGLHFCGLRCDAGLGRATCADEADYRMSCGQDSPSLRLTSTPQVHLDELAAGSFLGLVTLPALSRRWRRARER
jgi:hypothetical protein